MSEADDVLEFLNSLPESEKDGKKDDSDILNFLDELEKSDKVGGKATKNPTKVEQPAQPTKESTEQVKEEAKPAIPEALETKETKEREPEQETFVDPISSISNWWSSSGSATVNSLWSNAQQLRQKAQDEATKLAKDANIDEHMKRLQLDETRQRILNAGEDIDPSRALGFFTKNFSQVYNSIMTTDEVLNISLIHDLENYSVDSLVTKSFKKVMRQVQGGIDIEVRRSTSKDHDKRNLNIFQGKGIDAEKLAFANLETGIKNLVKLDEEIRSSDIIISVLAVQPLATTDSESLLIDTSLNTSFHFLIILKDITNDIEITTKSQAFPIGWANWLDASTEGVDSEEVDPAEWVKEWVYDGIGLSMGVLAQSYVVKRMGYD